MSQPIGQINGKWAILFKAAITMVAFGIPFVITLHVYQIKSIFSLKVQAAETAVRVEQFMMPGPRYTAVNAEADLLRMKQEIMSYIEGRYPPKWLVDRMDDLAVEVDKLQRKMGD